jgi:putative Ca2+/H+ antiporter (TMEM165/GDT1 family)
MADWKLFLSTFVLIFFAELPDKTAFATLLLACVALCLRG